MAIIANLDIVLGVQTAKGAANVKSFSAGISALRNNVVNLATAFGTFLAARSAINAALNFADGVADLVDFGQAVGDTYNNLKALQFQAEQSGTSFEALQSALTKTEVAFSRAASGERAQAEAIAELGLKVSELSQLTPTERFFALADALNSLPDPAKRAGLAAEIFGRSWSEIGVVLREGSAAFDAARQRVEELGLNMSQEQAENIKQFGDRVNELKFALQGLTAETLVQMVSALTNLTVGLTDVALAVKDLLGEFDSAILQGVTFTTTFISIVLVAPKVIGAIRAIITALRGLVVTSVIANAAAGPAGLYKAAAQIVGISAALLAADAITAKAFTKVETTTAAAAASAEDLAAQSAAATENMEEQAKAADALADSQAKAADAARQLAEDMRQRGDDLRKSLRTPIEEFRDNLAELRELASFQAIDPETASRAITENVSRLRSALQQAAQPITLNLGSAARGSAEAATTLLTRKLDANANVSRQIVGAVEEGNDTLEEIENILRRVATNSGIPVAVHPL